MDHETTILRVGGKKVGSCTWYWCPDDAAVTEGLKSSAAVAEYQCLKESGFIPCFPASVIWWLEISPESQRRGLGRKLLRKVLADLKVRGAVSFFAKVQYGSGSSWRKEREWKETFYASEGFTLYTDGNIRPLMTMKL